LRVERERERERERGQRMNSDMAVNSVAALPPLKGAEKGRARPLGAPDRM
jgi:hypothetical protein